MGGGSSSQKPNEAGLGAEGGQGVKKHTKVCVLGAGVVGLSVAQRLIERIAGMNVDVTIVADHFLQDTTSGGAGGLWEPYALSHTDIARVISWAAGSYAKFESMVADSAIARAAGVQRVVSYELFTDADEARVLPDWAPICASFKVLSDAASIAAAIPRLPARQAGELPFAAAFEYSTFTADQRFYLPYLTQQLERAGVLFVSQHVESLDELLKKGDADSAVGYDVVINCTGLGAGKLIGKPESMYPLRGQVVRVATPADWLCSPAGDVAGDGVQLCLNWPQTYIIPNQGCLVMGGTLGDPTNWDSSVLPEHSEAIRARIGALFPELAEAPLIKEWAGLRPCNKTGVCLESSMDRLSLVVHCYGHGGSGVTLAAGCAVDVVDNHVLPHLKQRLT